jgi:hypothetical protein
MHFPRKQYPANQLRFALLISGISVPFLRNVTCAIHRMCRYQNPSLVIDVAQMCMATLLELIQHTETEILGKQLKVKIS